MATKTSAKELVAMKSKRAHALRHCGVRVCTLKIVTAATPTLGRAPLRNNI